MTVDYWHEPSAFQVMSITGALVRFFSAPTLTIFLIFFEVLFFQKNFGKKKRCHHLCIQNDICSRPRHTRKKACEKVLGFLILLLLLDIRALLAYILIATMAAAASSAVVSTCCHVALRASLCFVLEFEVLSVLRSGLNRNRPLNLKTRKTKTKKYVA
jgi:hypothetical protein